MATAKSSHLVTGVKDVDPEHRFDVPRLQELFSQKVEEFKAPLRVRQFRGGQSNPTYELSDARHRWVLRRKPMGELLKSAHAVDREFRIISALHSAGFPVPNARFLCEDDSIIGSMFFVMDHVEGRILVDPTLPDEEPAGRRAIYDSMLETLARLHDVDYAAIGLADFGRPGNYFARQAARWTKQYRAAEDERIPAMEHLIEWLPEHLPDDDSSSIVHGDYGLNNLITHPTEPRVVAILDWELSTIGHPLADLTYHLSMRHSPNGQFADLRDSDLQKLGIPTEDEYVARYCECSGRDGIPNLDFYLAFHAFRSASIYQGIARRVKTGTAAGEGASRIGAMVRPLAEHGASLAR